MDCLALYSLLKLHGLLGFVFLLEFHGLLEGPAPGADVRAFLRLDGATVGPDGPLLLAPSTTIQKE